MLVQKIFHLVLIASTASFFQSCKKAGSGEGQSSFYNNQGNGGYYTSGYSSGGNSSGTTSGASSGGSTSGATTGGSTSGATTGGSTSGATTGGSTSGATTGGSTSGATTGGSTSGATTGGSTSGATTGGSTSGATTGGTTGGGADQSCQGSSGTNPWGFNDPYFCHQWHLRNVGQGPAQLPSTSAFFPAGTAGADMKLTQTFNDYSGSGVKIYITDDGLYHTHPDIAANFLSGYDFCTNQNVPTPKGNHGTMVSGLIAAVGKNGIGVSGISYEAKIFVNNIVSGCQAGGRWVDAILTQPQGYQVWSGSFGMSSTGGFSTRTQNLPHYDSYVTGANNYNIIYQKANGNDGPNGNGNSDPSGSVHTIANIGALNNKRQPASYTSPGANLLISNYAGRDASGPTGVCTISQANSYTCIMNGTSAATPNTSGAIGLMKEARPDLKWHDAHSILARTGDALAESETSSCGLLKNCINYVTNGHGYRHSYTTGFGSINTDAAVNMAKTATLLPVLEKYSVAKNSNAVLKVTGTKSVSASQCASYQVSVPQDFQVYSLDISIAYSGAISQMGLFMKMPDGKVGQLIRPSAIPGNTLTFSHYLKSMQALGINAKGVWDFEVCSKGAGTYSGVSLDIFGWSSVTTFPRK